MHRKDPLANRLFAHIVSCLHNRKDQTLGLCEVKLKDVMTWADSEKDYERVKKAVQVLGTSVVEVENKNEKIYQLKRLFGDDITYYGKKGIIRTELNPTLKDFFLNLHEYYTTYGLMEFSSLRSFYSQRLFEIACSIKPKFEETFTLRKLQHMLDITEGSLLTYGNFKQKVLEPAKKEIIKYTNMKFDYEPIKEGRAIAEVKIKARRMNNNDLLT